jgi:hypothetical protein
MFARVFVNGYCASFAVLLVAFCFLLLLGAFLVLLLFLRFLLLLLFLAADRVVVMDYTRRLGGIVAVLLRCLLDAWDHGNGERLALGFQVALGGRYRRRAMAAVVIQLYGLV